MTTECKQEEKNYAVIKIDKCPDCGSTRLMKDYELAEIVCMNCGFVLDYNIADRGPEWRAFDQEQRAKKVRAGAPLTYTVHDKGLSTEIDWHDHDIHGKSLSPIQKAQVRRLRKWQRRISISDSSERNLAYGLSDIKKIAQNPNLNLPKIVIEQASVVLRKASKERLFRGRSIHEISSGAIYLACRQCGLTRTLEEVAEVVGLEKKYVGRSYSFLVKELNYTIPPPKPSQYVSKVSNQLTVNGKTNEIIYKTLAAAKELRLTSGRGPMGIAGAATYIASVLSGERRTQKDIAETLGVTEVTIRNRYTELVERLMFYMTL